MELTAHVKSSVRIRAEEQRQNEVAWVGIFVQWDKVKHAHAEGAFGSVRVPASF